MPSVVKIFILRHVFGYRIGKGVRIGVSIIDTTTCSIGDNVRIGHFNIFIGTGKLTIGEHSRIGVLNIFRGGEEISIGRYCEILRLNEINSISEPDVADGMSLHPVFKLGDGAMLGASHKIDFTDQVSLGRRVILGGRNSSIWTHNRQETAPIVIGDNTYLGSEIRIAPGARVPANCVVGMGAVITKVLSEEYTLFGGVPAVKIRKLDDASRKLIETAPRKDLPHDI